MRRSTKFAAVLTAGILSVALSACGGSDSGSSSSSKSSGSASGTSKVQVGMAYDIGGRGDQSFNDMAAAGLDRAKSEFGIKASESEATPDEAESAKEDRLIQLADAGYNPVIAVGFVYSQAVGKIAKQYPKTKFAIIDDSANKDANVTNLVFAEEQGSFLVGAAAALKSKTGHIGFIGGVNTPLINKFEAGYDAGAKAVNPKIKIESAYLTQPPDFTGFNDPGKGKTAAGGEFDAGADVVYHAAGGSGLGVFQAAKAAKGLAIGVDSDQYKTASPDLQPVILTSMIKHVDVAVYSFIKSIVDGKPLTGTQTFDLKVGGVDYATSGGQVDDIKSKLDDYKKKIIDGTIVVPTTVK
ncbi:BMP family ABC transporter substrate-binding protein [Nocardioides sp. AN3]